MLADSSIDNETLLSLNLLLRDISEPAKRKSNQNKISKKIIKLIKISKSKIQKKNINLKISLIFPYR